MSTKIYKTDGAIIWVSGMAIDADGCYNTYAPPGPLQSQALDYLANAGSQEKGWYGIVTDEKGHPVIQKEGDPCKGFYISPTSLHDKTKKTTDPYRYVNSATVPYISIPKDMLGQIKLGDLCMVLYKDLMTPAIVADVGPRSKYGEASMACASRLGINPSPKSGGCSKGVCYVIFPESKLGWPVDFEEAAKELFARWGGTEKVNEVLEV